MKKLNVKKDDTVVVISGKDKGKQGKVLTAFPAEERVVVQGACTSCSQGTRIAHKIGGDKKTRVCKHGGAEL